MDHKMTNLRSQINGELCKPSITWTIMKFGSHIEVTKVFK